MATTESFKSGYCPVNGLQIYYEETGEGGVPLIMIHGVFCTANDLHPLMSELAKHRRVIAVEYQGHGRTADIDDRALSAPQLADDVAGVLDHLGISNVDVYGYNLGGGVAQHLAIRHPSVVRKLVVASTSYSPAGFPPEMLAGLKGISVAHLAGLPYEATYKRLAPNPENFERLVEKVNQLNTERKAIPEDDIRAIKAPTFILIGDADVVTLEHAVEMFRLLGGGVVGDMVGMPKSQLAVIPNTSHTGMMRKASFVGPMINEFLDRDD